MGDINSVRAKLGLQATGTPTSTNVTGLQRVGEWPATNPLADCDIVYSFSVEATGTLDVATLDLQTGIVTQTTGTPTITDGDGNDFEGDTLPAMLTLKALHVNADEGDNGSKIDLGSGDTVINGSFTTNATWSNTLVFTPSIFANGYPSVGKTIAITIPTSGDKVTVTVAGSTSL